LEYLAIIPSSSIYFTETLFKIYFIIFFYIVFSPKLSALLSFSAESAHVKSAEQRIPMGVYFHPAA
jgi:hypothetical protein